MMKTNKIRIKKQTQDNTENLNTSNTDRTKTPLLAKGKHFLLLILHPSC